MYLGALSLRLDFLHYEEACIQKSFNAVHQAALFTPREPRRGRTSDTFVPAHTGKGVDRLLDTRLRLLPVKESLELFLCGVIKAVSHGGGT
jgi:hypothetical protein